MLFYLFLFVEETKKVHFDFPISCNFVEFYNPVVLVSLKIAIQDLLVILTISGARNHPILTISGARNASEPEWRFLGPEIIIFWWFLGPETVPFWRFLGPEIQQSQNDDFWGHKSSFSDDFWGQKSSFKDDFWGQKFH